MPSLTIVGPNLRDQSKGDFHVHREGCADLKRDPNYRHVETYTAEFDSLEQVVTLFYDDIMQDNDEDWTEYRQYFHVLPCVCFEE